MGHSSWVYHDGMAWWQEVKAIDYYIQEQRDECWGSWFHFSLFLSRGPQPNGCGTHIQGSTSLETP